MSRFCKFLALFLVVLPMGLQASTGELKLDPAPKEKFSDLLALQRGAKVFVNYCLNCHGASYMRYNRLQDIGLTDDQIRDNLLFSAEKVGEPMRVALQRDDGNQWFGAAPPDLTLIARSRASEFGSGADWLYTYLRSFYRDSARPTGWNNVVFPNVGMPHVLWELQGTQEAEHKMAKDAHGHETSETELKIVEPGKMSKAEYDSMVGDLVAYLVYMGEPAAETRKKLGIIVIAFLAFFAVLSYLLKREYWKDIH